MFKSKSFDLINEEREKQQERLYEPRRVRWMKYILVPALALFVLMLILSNVDFSYEPPQIETDNAAVSNYRYARETESQTTDIIPALLLDSQVQAIATCKLHLSCTVICNANLVGVAEELETQWPYCKSNYYLRLENCQFPNDVMTADLFKGEFSLYSLSVENCSLTGIADGAFAVQGMANLFELKFSNTQLKKLDYLTFRGLNSLQNFTMINATEDLQGVGFFEPLADNLRWITIRKQAGALSEPSTWFGSSLFPNLEILDLNSNTFSSQITNDTFENMPALQQLLLADCGLSEVGWSPTSGIFSTLQYLDLSDNNLQILSAELVQTAIEKSIVVELFGNAWECSCNNEELIQYVNDHAQDLQKVPECFSPAEQAGKAMNTICLDCTTTSSPAPSTISDVITPPTRLTTARPTSPEPNTTTIDLETDPTTITNDLETDPTTITNDLETDAISTTTESEEIASPLDAELVCVNPKGQEKNNTRVPYDAVFRIEDETSTEVSIILSQLEAEKGQFVYFCEYDSSIRDVVNVANYEISVPVQNLFCSTSYVFCLVVKDGTTSPFNCRSHRTMVCVLTQSWFEAHCVLIVSLGIAGILVSVIAGIAAVYATLWFHPTWMRGSSRLIRPNRDSKQMMLIPRSGVEDEYGIRSPNSISKNCEYIAYYRQVEQAKLYQTESSSYMSPGERAPSVPPSSQLDIKPLSSSNPAKADNNVYESLELYEELF